MVGTTAYLAISGAALLGVAATPSPERIAVVLVVVLAAIALPAPQPGEWHVGAWVGILVGLAGVAGLELITGNPSIGAGQIGALVGASVVFPVLNWVWGHEPRIRLVHMGLVLLVVLVAVALIRSVIDGGGLGHDESAYALKARSWLAGTPDTGWQLHRAPLNSLLAVPVIIFTENEEVIRMVGAILAVASLAGVGLVAGRLAGGWGAIVAMATVGASHPFLRRGSEFLTDVAAAGILLVIFWVVLKAISDPERDGRLVIWLGPLIAAAFYMRYQSALAVLGIALAAVVVWPRVMVALRRPLVIAGSLLLIGLLPHLIWATAVTGEPWGVVLITRDAGGREFLGEGLIDYVRMFPIDLAGPLGALAMGIGLVWVVWRSALRLAGSADEENKTALFVLIVLLVAVVPLGLVAHGEPRFVFFPSWLLIAVGTALVVNLITPLRQPYKAMAVALAALLWLPVLTETTRRVDRNAEARGDTFAVIVDASNAIQGAGTGSCSVLTTYQPQVTWYSECATGLLRARSDGVGEDTLEGDRRYVLLFENGKRQPSEEVLREHIELEPARTIPARNDRIGDATIIEINSG